MESYVWQVVSPTEYEMAEEISTKLIAQNLSMDEYVDVVENIEQYIHKNIINLEQSFSGEFDCISNNVISQIAYSLSEKLQLNGGNGVVLTSNVLAEDMVKMSIIEWFNSNTHLSRQAVANYLYAITKLSSEDELFIKEHLAALTWYDKTTPRLIQFHTLKNAANPPLLGGFSIFGTVAA